MARLFNKNNPDYVDFGDVVKITGDEITVSCWVKLDSANGDQKFIARWSDSPNIQQYLMSITSAEKLQFAIYNNGVSLVIGSTTISTGTWHNLIGRYNGSNIRCYIDGIQDGTFNTTGDITSNAPGYIPLVLGAGSGGNGSEAPFDGCLGHVAIWDLALTDDEIKSLSNGINPLQIRPEGLVFYNPLNGQSPEHDIVGDNNGTVNGTTKVGEPPISKSIKAP